MRVCVSHLDNMTLWSIDDPGEGEVVTVVIWIIGALHNTLVVDNNHHTIRCMHKIAQ